MRCNPKPVVTCGTTINDTCVNFTGVWPTCYPNPDDEDCFRQSEFNEATGDLICQLLGDVTDIQESIDLDSLTACEGIIPSKTTVVAEFQQLYDLVCGIKLDLNLPITGLTIPECIKDPCDNTPDTLGTLLQAILNKIEECCCASGN